MGELISPLLRNTVGISGGGHVTYSNAKGCVLLVEHNQREMYPRRLLDPSEEVLLFTSLPNWTTIEKSSIDSWKEGTNCRSNYTLGNDLLILKSNKTPQGWTKLTWAAPLLSSIAYDSVARIYNTKRWCECNRMLKTLKNTLEVQKSAPITRFENMKSVKKELSSADLDTCKNLLII